MPFGQHAWMPDADECITAECAYTCLHKRKGQDTGKGAGLWRQAAASCAKIEVCPRADLPFLVRPSNQMRPRGAIKIVPHPHNMCLCPAPPYSRVHHGCAKACAARTRARAPHRWRGGVLWQGVGECAARDDLRCIFGPASCSCIGLRCQRPLHRYPQRGRCDRSKFSTWLLPPSRHKQAKNAQRRVGKGRKASGRNSSGIGSGTVRVWFRGISLARMS
jgi:hypothetical protein